MKLWIVAAIALAAALSGFMGGWKVRDWQAGADTAQRLELEGRDAARRSEKAIGAAQSYENEKAIERPKVITRIREVTRAVQADPDCSGRPLPASLRDALTDAAASGNQPVPAGAMPAASSAEPYDLGRPRDGLFRGLGGTLRLPGAASSPR